MKVFGISVHGRWTDEFGHTHELPYGISSRDKIFSDIDAAKKHMEEKVIPSCTAWIEASRIDGDVFLRPRNSKYEKDVLCVSIVTLYLDENDN